MQDKNAEKLLFFDKTLLRCHKTFINTILMH